VSVPIGRVRGSERPAVAAVRSPRAAMTSTLRVTRRADISSTAKRSEIDAQAD
jgi:hypothetical protein